MRINFLVSCLCLILVLGCKKNKDNNIIVNIEDDFYVDMFEDISNGERRFELRITTIKDQPCLNASIDYDLDFEEQSNTIDLSINDLVDPEQCIEGSEPVFVIVPFGSLNSGTYTFNINLKDAVVNKGRLVVYNDRYEMSMESDDGIEIVHEELMRIPNNTIWGYVGYDVNNASADATDFISELKNLPNVFDVQNNNLYKPGYYGYFNLEDNKDILLSGEINANNFRSFIFQQEDENPTNVETLINTTCVEHAELTIEMFMQNGQELNCN